MKKGHCLNIPVPFPVPGDGFQSFEYGREAVMQTVLLKVTIMFLG